MVYVWSQVDSGEELNEQDSVYLFEPVHENGLQNDTASKNSTLKRYLHIMYVKNFYITETFEAYDQCLQNEMHIP